MNISYSSTGRKVDARDRVAWVKIKTQNETEEMAFALFCTMIVNGEVDAKLLLAWLRRRGSRVQRIKDREEREARRRMGREA